MRVTAERMQEIASRVEAASPGPWERFMGDGDGNVDVLDADFNHRFRATPADLAFLAAARTAVPDLLADLREARTALRAAERLKAAIQAFTVDAGTRDEPRPNGPAEAAFSRLAAALRALPDPVGTRIAALAAEFCEADVARLRELRLAAAEYFGETAQAPGT